MRSTLNRACMSLSCSLALGMLAVAGCSLEGTILAGPEVVRNDTSGDPGRNTSGDPGGNTGGDPGGNTAGDPGGNTAGDPGGNTGGDPGGNTGGDPGGNTGGDPGSNPACDTTPQALGEMIMATNTGLLASYGVQPFVPNVSFADSWAKWEAGAAPDEYNVWDPQYLDELEPYAAIRFMNWQGTNNSSTQTWDQRKPPWAEENSFTGWVDPGEAEPGMAYEWLVDLCNRTGKDLWINIPAMADANFHHELATLIKKYLDPNLKVYVEYSNETWNGIFSQKDYCNMAGNSVGLGDRYDPTTGYKYHVYAAVRIFKIFEDVFGEEKDRLVKIIAGFVFSTDVTEVHLAALEDPAINPDNVQIDAYAIAPYFGHGVDGAASNAADLLSDNIDTSVVQATQAIYNLVHPKGYALLAYEGGQHVLTNCATINRSPAICDVYVDYFNKMSQYFTLFAHYTHTDPSNENGCWGAVEYTGQPLVESPPKYSAIVKWVTATRNQ